MDTPAVRRSRHDIHDPLRHHDDLLRRLPGKRPLHRVKGQSRRLDRRLVRIAFDHEVRPLLAAEREIRFPFFQGSQQSRNRLGRVLQIGVEHDEEVAPRFG